MSGPFSTGGSGHGGRILLTCERCKDWFWWPSDVPPIKLCCACRYPFQGSTFAGDPVKEPRHG